MMMIRTTLLHPKKRRIQQTLLSSTTILQQQQPNQTCFGLGSSSSTTNFFARAIITKPTKASIHTNVIFPNVSYHNDNNTNDDDDDQNKSIKCQPNFLSSTTTTSTQSFRRRNGTSSSSLIHSTVHQQRHYNNNNNNNSSQSLMMLSSSSFMNNTAITISTSPSSIRRSFTSFTIMEYLPEVIQNISIWGGSGSFLKYVHGPNGEYIPYYGGFVLMSLLVRTLLFPVVVMGAKTATRLGVVIPEIQFLVSLDRMDRQKLRDNPRINTFARHSALFRMNLTTLRNLYKLHNVNPLKIFVSPLLQLPIFWYISIDMRKILNGLDPTLAQELVDTSILWITDLTEPDPYIGLPILAGLIMYMNIEIAVGKKSLVGTAAAKADSGTLLKDIFQSGAIFMPCFTSQLPSGIQLYIVTSFVFTIGQSLVLRNNYIRTKYLGLPSTLTPPPEPIYAKEYIRLKQIEEKARKIRGDNRLLGIGILANGYECTFPGTNRPSTIITEKKKKMMEQNHGIDLTITTTKMKPPHFATDYFPPEIKDMTYIEGVSAPVSQLIKQYEKRQEQQTTTPEFQKDHAFSGSTTTATNNSNNNNNSYHYREIMNPDGIPIKIQEMETEKLLYMPEITDDIMEKANRGDPSILSRHETFTMFDIEKMKQVEKQKQNRPLNMERYKQQSSSLTTSTSSNSNNNKRKNSKKKKR